MHFTILTAIQAADSSVIDSLSTAASSSQSMSFFDLLVQGGWLMIPLAISSIVAVYLIVERWLSLNHSQIDVDDFLDRVEQILTDGNRRKALNYCDSMDKPLARILKAGISKLGRPIESIEDALENAGKKELFFLEKRMNWLATVSGVAPLLGFTGTVTGLMKAFMQIQALHGNVNPSVLAGGIWEALVTTVVGLIIGIIAYSFYNFFLGKINRIVLELETASADFIDLLQAPSEGRDKSTYKNEVQ